MKRLFVLVCLLFSFSAFAQFNAEDDGMGFAYNLLGIDTSKSAAQIHSYMCETYEYLGVDSNGYRYKPKSEVLIDGQAVSSVYLQFDNGYLSAVAIVLPVKPGTPLVLQDYWNKERRRFMKFDKDSYTINQGTEFLTVLCEQGSEELWCQCVGIEYGFFLFR